MELKNLLTDEDLQLLHELKKLTPIIKNKGASFVREIDKFLKLIEKLGGAK